tara:strand:+ start:2351 stop:2842 length:492 start_codon:yes stop_codon:yes gene_type:complete
MFTGSETKVQQLMVVGLACLLSACDQGPKSGSGFVLPEGDAAAGEAAFVQLHCNDCHSIEGKATLKPEGKPLMSVKLGGPTSRISTYGELVTSIINPSHKVSRRYDREPYVQAGESSMRNYNELMTVAQLGDLVTFLQQQYALEPFAGPSYISYYPRNEEVGN